MENWRMSIKIGYLVKIFLVIVLSGCSFSAFSLRHHVSLQKTTAYFSSSTSLRVILSKENEILEEKAALDQILTLNEANSEEDDWHGHKEGFDWQLERARRALQGPGFSPFRMTYWEPLREDEKDVNDVPFFYKLYILFTNIIQNFGGPSIDGAPVAVVGKFKGSLWTFLGKVLSGKLEDLAGGPLFLLLQKYHMKYGPVFKLAFGPRSFIVVSDPVMAKHILKSSIGCYDKGVLATILEPIMGKGLIPADTETWKIRRKAIVPGFHKRWLNRMMHLFADCNLYLIEQVGAAADDGRSIDMEEKFCSVTLDIIGSAVFNYKFGSTTHESPVVKAVYRVLREAEHRSSSFIPYWKIPLADRFLASQRVFQADLNLLNDVLNQLIREAEKTQDVADVEELEQRDLDSAKDPSLLRFLIDMRGEDTTSKQMRDDLMTMLIAGHETTAAVLTWTMFNLAQDPELQRRVQNEIDEVLGSSEYPTFDDLSRLKLTRYSLVEALRLYPEPPILIRRALKEDILPRGGAKNPIRLLKGSDVFISTWNLHRSPDLWKDPEKFNPERFLESFSNEKVEGWKGFDPSAITGLYPSEIASDFAFLPFGGGKRKCIGDQFAMMEAVVTLSMLLKNFEMTLSGSPEDTGMVTGATIHTANGLMMKATRRI